MGRQTSIIVSINFKGTTPWAQYQDTTIKTDKRTGESEFPLSLFNQKLSDF